MPTELNVNDFQTLEDRAVLDNFDEIPIPSVMRRILKTDAKYIGPWLRQRTANSHDYHQTIQIMRRGVLVTENQFAWLKREVDICAKILHVSPAPRVFVVRDGEIPAKTINFKNPFIMLSSELVEKSSPEAIRFVIGQQIGHIKCDHVFYQTLFSGGLDSLQFVLGRWVQELINSFLGKVTDLILVDWVLAREISADRAGLIACQDLEIAQQALLNLRLVMPSDQVNINAEDYLRQAHIVAEKQAILLRRMPAPAQKAFGHWQRSNQLELNEPFLFERLKALQEYADSGTYRRLFE